MESKLRKWEDELKLREAKLSGSDVDYKRMEDYVQKTEARNLELETIVRTLQRRISLLEQTPYSLDRPNAKPYLLDQGILHKDGAQVNPNVRSTVDL